MVYILAFIVLCFIIYLIAEDLYKRGTMEALPCMKNKFVYYLLQFTWGLPMNIAGLIVAGVMMICGKRPVRYGYGWCFERKGDWGLELGIFFIAPPTSTHTKNHELGHGIQNIYFGPLTVFVVSLPSVFRFWWRKLMTKLGKPPKTRYDDAWFEGQATKTGTRFMSEYEKEE